MIYEQCNGIEGADGKFVLENNALKTITIILNETNIIKTKDHKTTRNRTIFVSMVHRGEKNEEEREKERLYQEIEQLE
jgi:hypothetical protein